MKSSIKLPYGVNLPLIPNVYDNMSSPSLSMTFLLFFSSVSVKTYALWLDIFHDIGYRILVRDKLRKQGIRAHGSLLRVKSSVFLLVGGVPQNPLKNTPLQLG